mgnify:CR=1 FL=1
MNDDDNSYKEKDIAFYSATLNAWYTTKFEKDKHLLSLASVGIGLLVTLATAVGVYSIGIASMYILAVISFLICIMSVLSIFSRNAGHLKKLIREEEDNSDILKFLDKTASGSFIFGIIFTLLVGLTSGIHNFKQMEADMANDTEKMVNTSNNSVKKSVDGAAGMRPSKPNPPSTSQSGSSDKK